MHGMEHVIPLLSKRHVPVWRDNDLRFIVPQDHHQLHILSRVSNQVMELEQENIDEAMGLIMAGKSALPRSLHMEEDYF